MSLKYIIVFIFYFIIIIESKRKKKKEPKPIPLVKNVNIKNVIKKQFDLNTNLTLEIEKVKHQKEIIN